jgi:tetratricopeptide (TPR) repeat protein
LTKLDNLRQAESHLLEASRIDPERPEPLLNLAVLAERRTTGEAEAWYNRAIEVATKTKNPLSAKLLMLRAQFFDRQVPPQKVRMRIDLQELLKLDPDFPGANGLLGLHYETLGRTEDALRHLEREVQRQTTQNRSDPIYLECLYRLARIYSDKEHNPTKALQYATLYHRLQPDSPLSRDLKNRTAITPSPSLESPPPVPSAHEPAHEPAPTSNPHANPAQKIGHH